jgi:hypothetical protein
MEASLQACGVTMSNTHGSVAARKLNLMIKGLECLGSYYLVNNAYVKRIGKIYLVIHGNLCPDI